MVNVALLWSYVALMDMLDAGPMWLAFQVWILGRGVRSATPPPPTETACSFLIYSYTKSAVLFSMFSQQFMWCYWLVISLLLCYSLLKIFTIADHLSKIMDLPLVIFLQFEHLLSLILNPVFSFVSSRAT